MRMFEALKGGQSLDGSAGLLLGQADLIKALQVQPEFRSRAEKMSETQGRVTGDCPPSIQDLRDAVGRDIQLPREFGGAHAQLLKLFGQMFSGVNCHDGHGAPPNGNRRSPRLKDRARLPSIRSKSANGR